MKKRSMNPLRIFFPFSNFSLFFLSTLRLLFLTIDGTKSSMLLYVRWSGYNHNQDARKILHQKNLPHITLHPFIRTKVPNMFLLLINSFAFKLLLFLFFFSKAFLMKNIKSHLRLARLNKDTHKGTQGLHHCFFTKPHQ